MTSPHESSRWTAYRVIWCWYLVPLMGSLILFAKMLLGSWDLIYCNSCEELQVFVMAWFALLPWLALVASHVVAAILPSLRARHPVVLGHVAAGPLVIALAYFFIVNTGQYLP